jgi:DNA-binding NarL/FixJ family response regulator
MTQKNFKLVIVDITLPCSSAKQIITDFKKQFPEAITKFVVLKSEADSEKEVAELKKMGVQGIVDKNKIEPSQFAAGVKKMLK